ncbi:7-carboxy-7-deazaguanine synthase QueE [Polynucleobacter sp.]|uniref:7-carboxy-7-deazaguanine synthase QueE n=1 Tax=Polynucleobacter sp. TaxID=2029855 RepID=UPI003F69AACA
MLRVATLDGGPEVFYTIQGEGPSIGKPAVFVRLSLCNLQCVWCDTPYTWNWEGTPYEHEDNVKFSRSKEILAVDEKTLAVIIGQYGCKRVVITGGEPLLQQLHLPRLFDELNGHGYIYEVETNGTITPNPEVVRQVAQFNVSPKLKSSGNDPAKALKEEVLIFFNECDKAVFKFVVSDPDDLVEVMELCDLIGIDHSKVYLMPEGRDQEAIQANSLWLAEVCKDQQFNFTSRLHVMLWGAKKGV